MKNNNAENCSYCVAGRKVYGPDAMKCSMHFESLTDFTITLLGIFAAMTGPFFAMWLISKC